MTRIRLSSMPLYCSACAGQYPDRQHVDFEAECDRGYGDVLIQGRSEGQASNAPAIQMDDLVLCDQCVKEGARLIGMVDGERMETELHALEAQAEQLERRAEKAENEVGYLERFFRSKPKERVMDDAKRRQASERMKRLHEEGKLRKEPA